MLNNFKCQVRLSDKDMCNEKCLDNVQATNHAKGLKMVIENQKVIVKMSHPKILNPITNFTMSKTKQELRSLYHLSN